MIELRIEDYTDPRAERTVTVQSFKRQMGTEGHYPVKYGVATNFPGTVTLRWATGSATVTDGSRITTWLDEGTMVVTADATGVAVNNGTYYVFLLQDESQKELQVAIVVALEYYAIPELGIYPTAAESTVTVAAADPCVSPSPLYTLEVAGYLVKMTRGAAVLPLWGDDLKANWNIIRDGPGLFRTFSVVAFPLAISSSASDYCTLEFSNGSGGRTFTIRASVPVPSFTWSREGDELVIGTTDFLRCSCGWLQNGTTLIAMGVRIHVVPLSGGATDYAVTLTDHGESVTFDPSGGVPQQRQVFDFVSRINAGDAPQFSHETIPYIQGARILVQVRLNIANQTVVPQYNHVVINSLP